MEDRSKPLDNGRPIVDGKTTNDSSYRNGWEPTQKPSPYSLYPWWSDEKIAQAVNACMAAIEQAKLTAGQAMDVPALLLECIQESNQALLDDERFQIKPALIENIIL